MKLITFAVPCYNSEAYMRKCIDSLLLGGEQIEIILVDDGSTDSTPQIADEYMEKHPEIIKVIHKENGGHGSGILAGLTNATGLYYKVVDSDDWVDPNSMQRVLNQIETMLRNNDTVDLLICNYVYEYASDNSTHTVNYHGIFPKEKKFGWDDCKHFDLTRYMTMHSAFFKTELLHQANLQIPLHTFYVDNIFVYTPLPMVQSIYYLDADFYRYFIGRADQSVNEKILVQRVDQQILVSKLLLNAHKFKDIEKISKKLHRFMLNYCSIIITASAMLLTLEGTEESIKKLMDYWDYIKTNFPKEYKYFRYRSIAGFFAFKNPIIRKITLWGYRIVRDVYKFT